MVAAILQGIVYKHRPTCSLSMFCALIGDICDIQKYIIDISLAYN